VHKYIVVVHQLKSSPTYDENQRIGISGIVERVYTYLITLDLMGVLVIAMHAVVLVIAIHRDIYDLNAKNHIYLKQVLQYLKMSGLSSNSSRPASDPITLREHTYLAIGCMDVSLHVLCVGTHTYSRLRQVCILYCSVVQRTIGNWYNWYTNALSQHYPMRRDV
jgi:hypothetical protein